MRYTHFDLDVLRSFTTGVALGSFAQAADRLGRSTSAVSAQLKKLESQANTSLFRKAGRGLELTDAGQTLLAYAHRMLDLNDEAAAAMHASQMQGIVRLGLPEDLGENVLPVVLGRFSRAHPRVQVQVSSGNSGDLRKQYEDGLLDLTLSWALRSAASEGAEPMPNDAEDIAHLPLCWIGPADVNGRELADQPWWPLISGSGGLAPDADEAEPWNALPLVLLADPCPLRAVVTSALNRSGVPWRFAFSSASLAASWAAVASGLGLAVRTPFGLPGNVKVMDNDVLPALPRLPTMVLQQHCKSQQASVLQLKGLLEQEILEHLKMH